MSQFEPSNKIVIGPGHEVAKEPAVPEAPGAAASGSFAPRDAVASKEEFEMRLYWAAWMNMSTGENNHAGPAQEADVDKFIVQSGLNNKNFHFWKIPLGGILPWRDGLEMYEAYTGKKLRQ